MLETMKLALWASCGVGIHHSAAQAESKTSCTPLAGSAWSECCSATTRLDSFVPVDCAVLGWPAHLKRCGSPLPLQHAEGESRESEASQDFLL